MRLSTVLFCYAFHGRWWVIVVKGTLLCATEFSLIIFTRSVVSLPMFEFPYISTYGIFQEQVQELELTSWNFYRMNIQMCIGKCPNTSENYHELFPLISRKKFNSKNISSRFVTAVYPSLDDDVITSPYNSVLAMRQLTDNADCVLPVENQVIFICIILVEDFYDIENSWLHLKDRGFHFRRWLISSIR